MVTKSPSVSEGAKSVVPSTGFEPVAYGLEVRCSIQLSYEGIYTVKYTYKLLNRLESLKCIIQI